jgi:DNA-binding NtrC family response regulator
VRILIVDDEIEILLMLRRNLEMEGYQVTTTVNPQEALDLARRNLFNLIVTDIKTPGMSGVTLLKEIKRINPLANVIVMTGFSSMAHVVDCLGNGAVDYFVKPFPDVDILIQAIHQARDRLNRWRTSMGVSS